MKANPEKFQYIISHKNGHRQLTSLKVLTVEIQESPSVNLLGVLIDNRLCFNDHIDSLVCKTSRQVNALCRFCRYLSEERKLLMVKTFILCNFMYCSAVWHFCGKTNAHKLEKILKRALRFVFSDYSSSYEALLERAGLCSLEEGRLKGYACELFKARNGLAPSFLWDSFDSKPHHTTSETMTRCVYQRNDLQSVDCVRLVLLGQKYGTAFQTMSKMPRI